jgi:hypothetical protein
MTANEIAAALGSLVKRRGWSVRMPVKGTKQ